MAAPEEINADMLAFGNGKSSDIWVARQEHTDITLAPVTNALLVFAAPRAGERVADIDCSCGAPTPEFARAAGPSGRWRGWTAIGEGRTRMTPFSALRTRIPNSKVGPHPSAALRCYRLQCDLI